MRGKITKAAVEGLKAGKSLADAEVKGFVARRLPSGVITYGLRYRHQGKQRWLPLGLHGAITPAEARNLAKKRAGQVADGRDPSAERAAERVKATQSAGFTVNALLDNFVARHARKLRSCFEIERVFDRNVRPAIGTKSIYELRRRDIVEMLDRVEDGGAPVMADRVLAHVRKAFNWQAARDDDFNSPIVKGMTRSSPKQSARSRTLDDQDLRDVWKALDSAEVPACYPAFVRTLLLTAQRRGEVAGMTWLEIHDDIWTIPAERGDVQGHKTGDQTGDKVVPLTSAVRALLGTPKKRGFVFSTTNGKLAFDGFSKAKAALDAEIAALRKSEKRPPMLHWTHHDLRRTARSFMSAAGVSSDIAERVLGHVIPGVRGVYDRHQYLAEKRDALERLAVLVTQILR